MAKQYGRRKNDQKPINLKRIAEIKNEKESIFMFNIQYKMYAEFYQQQKIVDNAKDSIFNFDKKLNEAFG